MCPVRGHRGGMPARRLRCLHAVVRTPRCCRRNSAAAHCRPGAMKARRRAAGRTRSAAVNCFNAAACFGVEACPMAAGIRAQGSSVSSCCSACICALNPDINALACSASRPSAQRRTYRHPCGIQVNAQIYCRRYRNVSLFMPIDVIGALEEAHARHHYAEIRQAVT